MCPVSIDEFEETEEAEEWAKRKLKDQASIEETEAQASKEEAKGQAYQAYKTNNKEILVLLADCKRKKEVEVLAEVEGIGGQK